VSDADKNNINESARAIARNTRNPTRNGKRPRERERERERQTRAWQTEYLGNKNEQRFLRVIGEKDVRAHGNENFDDDGK